MGTGSGIASAFLLLVPIAIAQGGGSDGFDLTRTAEGFRASRSGPSFPITVTYDAAAATTAWSIPALGDQGPGAASLVFTRVLEFEDVDRDGAVGFGDRTLRTWSLLGIPASIQVEAFPSGPPKAAVAYVLNATRTPTGPLDRPPVEVGTLRVDVEFPSSSPSATVLLRFRFEDYPFTANATHLALETRLSSDSPWTIVAGAPSTELAQHAARLDAQKTTGAEDRWIQSSDPTRGAWWTSFPKEAPSRSASLHVDPVAESAAPPVIPIGLAGSLYTYLGGTLFMAAIVAATATRRLRRNP